MQELTNQVERSDLIMKEFKVYKTSSEQRIQKLEQKTVWVMQHTPDQANATLQWIGETGMLSLKEFSSPSL